MIVLVVGSTGAGKTTYSRGLSHELRAELFSIDDWMKSMFWQEMPSMPDYQWFVTNGAWYAERIQRCENLIFQLTVNRAVRGENSILDLGFSSREHRQKFIDLFRSKGVSVEMHFLDVPADERWNRVQKRNEGTGETFVMAVDRQMFDFVESIFEAPTAAEGVDLVLVPGSV